MAAAKAAVLLAALAAGAGAAPGKPGLWNALKERASDVITGAYAPPVTTSDLLRESSGLKVESCSTSNHSMLVEGVDFDVNTLRLTVRGALSREVLGGNLSAHIATGKSPASLSLRARAMRTAACLMHNRHLQPLCAAVKGRAANVTVCPIARGTKELSFAVQGVPRAIVAGEYILTFNAVDENARPVACVKVALHVPMGRNGESIRKLQAQPGATSPVTTASGTPGRILSPVAGLAAVVLAAAAN